MPIGIAIGTPFRRSLVRTAANEYIALAEAAGYTTSSKACIRSGFEDLRRIYINGSAAITYNELASTAGYSGSSFFCVREGFAELEDIIL